MLGRLFWGGRIFRAKLAVKRPYFMELWPRPRCKAKETLVECAKDAGGKPTEVGC